MTDLQVLGIDEPFSMEELKKRTVTNQSVSIQTEMKTI